jgi:tRNA U34 5-carboxymethylaminomethyl modifying enzyme MnmG/GidA
MQASGAVQIENDIRYAGYVALDRERIERQRKHASRTIPEGFDYGGVRHLRGCRPRPSACFTSS